MTAAGKRAAFLVAALSCFAWGALSGGAEAPSKPRFPMLSNDEACKRIPRAKPPLPAWARVLAASLPQTTAAMLRLDYLHREKNPLGPVLAGKLRWAAADALGCDYARRYAEADLRRHGLTEKELAPLSEKGRGLGVTERAAFAFARKLTWAASTVTDTELAELLKHFGAEKVVAIIHTVALANFHGRILLALKVEVEPDGPLPPLDLKPQPADAAKTPPVKRPPWDSVRKVKHAPATANRPAWDERKPADLARAVEVQKARKPRIPLPGPERLARIPRGARAEASRIVWTNISMGYQPLLTEAWFDCMRTFHGEAQLDRVFANCVFWVITRSNECFY